MQLLTSLRKLRKLSERDAAIRAGLARATLRSMERNPRGAKVEHLEDIARLFDHEVIVAIVPNEDPSSELSVVVVSLAVVRDGFDSWKIHIKHLKIADAQTVFGIIQDYYPKAQIPAKTQFFLEEVCETL